MLLNAEQGRRLPGAARGWGRGEGRMLPQSLQKEPTLPTPCFWAPCLQTCERKSFCCSSYPVHGNLLRWLAVLKMFEMVAIN